MHVYQVGDLYNPRLRMPTGDQAQYNWRQGAHELVLFLARPNMQECQDVARGRAEFGLFTEADLIVFLYRFGKQDWSEALYSYHLVSADQQSLSDPGDEGGEQRALLTVILVDRDSGRIATSLRALTLSPDFTQALHGAIREQANRPWPPTPGYDAQIQDLYRRYPSVSMLVRDAKARCVGGD